MCSTCRRATRSVTGIRHRPGGRSGSSDAELCFETGTTGLEPATSGVKWPCRRSEGGPHWMTGSAAGSSASVRRGRVPGSRRRLAVLVGRVSTSSRSARSARDVWSRRTLPQAGSGPRVLRHDASTSGLTFAESRAFTPVLVIRFASLTSHPRTLPVVKVVATPARSLATASGTDALPPASVCPNAGSRFAHASESQRSC